VEYLLAYEGGAKSVEIIRLNVSYMYLSLAVDTEGEAVEDNSHLLRFSLIRLMRKYI
jgi:hypothetical protein